MFLISTDMVVRGISIFIFAASASPEKQQTWAR